jgi:ATP-dependent protease Clp ATPase subunit
MKCSFCDKTREEVAALVSREDGTVRICNECVSVCLVQLSETMLKKQNAPPEDE